MEIWKDVVGYEGLYQVSNLGRVRSLPRYSTSGKILKYQLDRYGYYRVCLSKHNKNTLKQIHRLVAQAFIPNPNNLSFVNHKDEDSTNNKVTNLEWCTHEYNCNYGTRNKRISITQSVDICQYTLDDKFIKKWHGINYVSKIYNINHANIISCCKGKRKSAGGYKWRYTNDV